MLQSEESHLAADHEALFDRYCPVIYAYLRSHLSSREDIEDLTLDVFAAALENPSLLTWSGARQLAWLKSVARNKLVNSYRYVQRHPTVALDESVEDLPDPDEPEHILLRNETYGQLHRSIQQLPPAQQQLLLLRYGHGLTTAEIAALLHKSDQTIRQLLSRTVCLLRTLSATKGDSR
jgi:RNA polymerase sigma-70 factor, ECF subfamily